MAVELRRVQEQVTDLGLGWRPGDTVHTDLSLMRIRSRTGAVPPDGHRSMGERESAAAAAHRQASAATAPKLPSKIDWRDNNGNFVTPVRDQQFCGSCVAFGTAAVLESMIMIKAGVSKLPIDLSEAQLYFCYGPDHGAIALSRRRLVARRLVRLLEARRGRRGLFPLHRSKISRASSVRTPPPG